MIQPAQSQNRVRAIKDRKPKGRPESKAAPKAKARPPTSAVKKSKQPSSAHRPVGTASASKRLAPSRSRSPSSEREKPTGKEPAEAHAMGVALTGTAPLLALPGSAPSVGDVSGVQQTVGNWVSGWRDFLGAATETSDAKSKVSPEDIIVGPPRPEKWNPPEGAGVDGLIEWVRKKKLRDPNQHVSIQGGGGSAAATQEMSIVDLVEKVRHGNVSLHDQVKGNGPVLDYLKKQDWVEVAPDALSGQALGDWLVKNDIRSFDKLNQFMQERYSHAAFVDGNNMMPMRTNVPAHIKQGIEDIELRNEENTTLSESWPRLMVGLGSHLNLYKGSKGQRTYWAPNFRPSASLDLKDLLTYLAPKENADIKGILKSTTYDQRMSNAWYHALAAQVLNYIENGASGLKKKEKGDEEAWQLQSTIADLVTGGIYPHDYDKGDIRLRVQNVIGAAALDVSRYEKYALWSNVGRLMKKVAADVLNVSQQKAKKIPGYLIQAAGSKDRIVYTRKAERNIHVGYIEDGLDIEKSDGVDLEKGTIVKELEAWMDTYVAPSIHGSQRGFAREDVLSLFDLVVIPPSTEGEDSPPKIIPREVMTDFLEYRRYSPTKVFEYLYLAAGKGSRLAFQTRLGERVSPFFEPLDLYKAAYFEEAWGAADKFPALLENMRPGYAEELHRQVQAEMRPARADADLSAKRAEEEKKAALIWEKNQGTQSVEDVANLLNVHPNRLRGWIAKHLGYEADEFLGFTWPVVANVNPKSA